MMIKQLLGTAAALSFVAAGAMAQTAPAPAETTAPAADATANNNATQNAPAGIEPNGIIAQAARFPLA